MAWFRQTMEAVLNPFFLFFLIGSLGLAMLWLKGAYHKMCIFFSILLVLLLIISTGFLPSYLTHRLEHQYPILFKADPKIQWIVVLSGGQADRNDLPANSLLYAASLKRLAEGIRLYRQIPKARLLLSGGGYAQETPESSRLQEVALWFGIPSQAMMLELSSINTADQAYEVKKMVGQAPFYLVTSATHMPRAMALFKKQGLHPIAAPTDFTVYWDDARWQKFWLPNARNIVYFDIALHELLGITWARLTNKL